MCLRSCLQYIVDRVFVAGYDQQTVNGRGRAIGACRLLRVDMMKMRCCRTSLAVHRTGWRLMLTPSGLGGGLPEQDRHDKLQCHWCAQQQRQWRQRRRRDLPLQRRHRGVCGVEQPRPYPNARPHLCLPIGGLLAFSCHPDAHAAAYQQQRYAVSRLQSSRLAGKRIR